MAKITYNDLFALLDEMDVGAKDKTRTIENVSNQTVKNLLKQESDLAISKGVTNTLLIGTVGTAITSSIIGSIGGAGTGAVAAGVTTLGVEAGAAAAGVTMMSHSLSFAGGAAAGAAGGAAAGGAAGSAFPIVGTVIGATVGAAVGVFMYKRVNKRNASKIETLMGETLKKQNTIIRDLEKELAEIKEKYGDAIAQNDRYKYLIGILMANEELKKVKAA